MLAWISECEGRANRPGEPPKPVRRSLGHSVPSWVNAAACYFVTICTKERKTRPLMKDSLPVGLIASVAHLHQIGRWYAHLFLIMPDHIHGLISTPATVSMSVQVSSWKGFMAKKPGVIWQERFFDHRIRHDESLDEKARYIRMNPIRRGLVTSPEQWPHVFAAGMFDGFGSAGTPRPTI